MDIKRKIFTGITFVLMITLAACATAKPTSPPTAESRLQDTEWALVSLNGSGLIEGSAITLRFSATSIKGSGGCNTYAGSYSVSEDTLKLRDVYWTEMACMEPAGVMAQEQAYFAALNLVARYQVEDDRLALYDEAGAQVLAFVAADGIGSSSNVGVPPTTTVAIAPTATATAALTLTPVPPTVAPVVFTPPDGFKQYVDDVTGISLWVPENWTIVKPGAHGGPTLLLSYPEDKYIGGEGRQPGDTKCDLTIHPPDVNTADVAPQNGSHPPRTIISEQEVVLQSGQTGKRFEVDGMGRSVSLVTEVNARVVVLTCFGELAPFDEIAGTLAAAQESALRAILEAPSLVPGGSAVSVRFTLTNISSEGFFVLTWFTPLEGLAGDIFQVQREGMEAAYRGKLVKRGAPTSEDYVWLEAGESVSADIDLAQGYDFSQAGHYTLQFRSPRLSHTAKTAEEQAESLDALEPIGISCDPINVTVGQ